MRRSITASLIMRQHRFPLLLGALLASLSLVMAASPSAAGDFRLESFALRGGLSGGSPIGEEEQVYFTQADMALAARLPWEWEIASGWVFRTRLLTSAGVLRGAGETNAVFTLVPLDLAFGRKDGLITIDMGGGGALF